MRSGLKGSRFSHKKDEVTDVLCTVPGCEGK